MKSGNICGFIFLSVALAAAAAAGSWAFPKYSGKKGAVDGIVKAAVFDSTDSDADISVVKGHIIIDRGDKERVAFQEFLVMANSGEKAYFPPKGGGLTVNIPKGASNLGFDFGIAPEQAKFIEGNDFFTLAAPVYPGNSKRLNIGIHYDADFNGGRFDFITKAAYPIDSVVVLVSDPDIVLRGSGVKALGNKQFGGKVYAEYGIDRISKDKSLGFLVKTKGRGIGSGKPIIAGVIIIIIIAAIAASMKGRKRNVRS